MCSETSPRLSFSNDLSQEDEIPVDRRDKFLLESDSDFEFSICSSVHHHSSLADDLFAHGMIKVPETKLSSDRPINQIHRFNQLPPLPSSSESSPATNGTISKKEIRVLDSESEEIKIQPSNNTTSFWGFKRSSSVNCDIKKSLCSLPLLLRSNSTGSSLPNNPKQKQSKKSSGLPSPPSPAAGSSASYVYTIPNKPPLKKVYNNGSHNGNVKFSPVINVPFNFGLGSFLRNGKDKSTRK
ncbi:uncharacterized protein LOC126685931 [Mercurialis annua]|uniref:uncharacterized protein LOC126685931 n=1 Tax=Mercurialis annua TaxID=3986 RepID=UPI00215FA979|nr:uncharacterized protein LOC126685931 [Mercurialis annua]